MRLEGKIEVRLKSEGSHLIVEWSDNGIGMDEHIISGYLSRIGQSWYQSDEYRRLGLQNDPISRFGLGLLSCFGATASLVIETRKEPQLGAAPGYRVEIRDPLKYFRIQRREDLNIGTTVTMRIPAEKGVSKEALVSALRRIARYVRHSIEIDSDGVVSRVGSFGRGGAASSDVDESLSPQLRISSVNEESVAALNRLIHVSTVAFGGSTKDYEGYFSAALPRDLRSVKGAGNYKQWQFGDEVLDVENYLASAEQAVFVKGVMISGGKRAAWDGRGGFAASADSGWFSPRMMVNVRRPSNLNFNLARDRVSPQGLWVDEMWREIAGELYGEAFGSRGESVEERAFRLGGLGAFAGLPVSALKTLCVDEEIPTVVLEPGRGLALSVYGVLGVEFMEAPYELSYRLSPNDAGFKGFGEQSGLEGWEGERVLVLGGYYSRHAGAPWMGPIMRMVSEQLLADTYVVSEIALLRATEKDPVPLVAQIWRRGLGSPEHRAWTERAELAIQSGSRVMPSDILRGVCKDAPLLVKFPDEYQRYAAIGSRYWNISHEKVRANSMAILQLGIRVRKGEVAELTERAFSYFTGTEFLGYVVPSRLSGRRLALELPAQLLGLVTK